MIGPRAVESTSSVTGSAPLHPDHLAAHVARQPAVALAVLPRVAVAAQLFEEQVGVVGQAGGDAPGGEAVVPARDRRRADERRPGDRPVRRADGDEVPRGRELGGEVRVVAQDRPAGGRARRGDDPVVRPAAAGEDFEEGVQVFESRRRDPGRPGAESD